MTTAEVFANYLGLTPANAPWAFEKWRYCTECGMPQVLDEPAPCCPSGHCYHRLTATSPLAPEPTPGWRERLEEHRAFIALERLCAPRMYRATCLIYGNGEDQGETIKFDDTHPTHAVAHALIAADPALRSACERAADYNEKETNNA